LAGGPGSGRNAGERTGTLRGASPRTVGRRECRNRRGPRALVRLPRTWWPRQRPGPLRATSQVVRHGCARFGPWFARTGVGRILSTYHGRPHRVRVARTPA